MPATFVPSHNTVRVNMFFDNQGQVTENVFNVHADTAWDVAAMLILAADFRSWYDTHLKTAQHVTCKLTKITVTDITLPSSPGVEDTTGMPVAGTRAGIPVPQSITYSVQWHTNLRGRNYRGRTYHNGACLEDMDSGRIKDSTRTMLVGVYTSLLTGFTRQDAHLVVNSLYTNKAPRVEALPTRIISCSVEGNVDSQRRRLPGRGK